MQREGGKARDNEVAAEQCKERCRAGLGNEMWGTARGLN